MVALATALGVSAASGSLSAAGLAVGLYGLGGAVGGVLQSRIIDRWRQTPVLVVSGVVHGVALLALAAAARQAAVAQSAAAIAGVAAPQLGPCMRAVWLDLASDGADRRAALALEAVVVEVVFLLGPALVAGLLFLVSPAAILAAAAIVSVVGTLAFAASAPSLRWRPPERSGRLAGPLASAGVRTVLLATALFGFGDGVLQLAVAGYGVRSGRPAIAGAVLAAISLASVAGGLAYGTRAWPADAATRFAALHVALAAGLAAAGLGGRPEIIVALLVLPATCIAPIAMEGSVLLSRAAPEGTQTEAYAWSITAVAIGGAAGAAAGGALVDRLPLAAALAVAGAVVGLAGAATWTRRRSLRGSMPPGESGTARGADA